MEQMKNHQFEDVSPNSPLMATPLRTTSDGSSSLSETVSSIQSPSSDHAPASTKKLEPAKTAEIHKKKLEKEGTGFTYRIREHVKMGPKFIETMKGKLSVGGKIVKKGGIENIFRHLFGTSDGQKLLKASMCYLSTSAGPIAGILFISTEKVAFCSERSITVRSSSGAHFRIRYKVSIPVEKIKVANESWNVNKPAQKYIEIVTLDDSEFWFMGFVRYEKALMNLQNTISMSR